MFSFMLGEIVSSLELFLKLPLMLRKSSILRKYWVSLEESLSASTSSKVLLSRLNNNASKFFEM